MQVKGFIILIIVFNQFAAQAQVQLQTGSAEVSLPVYSYADNSSRLLFNMSLNYASGNGLKVDEVSSSAGTGWSLSGTSFVMRIQRGLPDDQIPREGAYYDTTKYPPGLLFSSQPVSKGCPNALWQYPLFGEESNSSYSEHNSTLADREHDYFFYQLNGRSGTFVLDASGNAQTLDDSRLIITAVLDNGTDSCRTAIAKFIITDENGIQYELSVREDVKVYKYCSAEGWYINSPGLQFTKNIATEAGETPFVTSAWYVSTVTDIKSNRQIHYEYEYERQEYNERMQAQYLAPLNDMLQTDPNTHAAINGRKILLTQNRSCVRKARLRKVLLPSGENLTLQYAAARKDISGAGALTRITVSNGAERLYGFTLVQNYFVKDSIKIPAAEEQPLSRLCLLAVQRFGKSDAEQENPYRFEYYTGSNATEDFVPPYFFHARDPWGYYNGSYAGVPLTVPAAALGAEDWKKLCLFNSPERNSLVTGGACEFYSNAKSGYARNGLLKSVQNPYGGKTVYEYAQNEAPNELCSRDTNAAGGVHVSRINQVLANGTDDLITGYEYKTADGASSLWGVEIPRSQKTYTRYYEPQSKYYIPTGGCKYRYKIPGRSVTQNNTTLEAYLNVKRVQDRADRYARQALTGLSCTDKAYSLLTNGLAFLTAFYIDFLPGDVINCSMPYDKVEQYMAHCNTPINYANALPVQFKRVVTTEHSPGSPAQGKTVYEFTSPDDFPLLLPANNYPYTEQTRYYKWAYGLPKTTKIFDNSNRPVSSSTNTYRLIGDVSTNAGTQSCNCDVQSAYSYRYDLWDTEAATNFTTADVTGKMRVGFSNIAKGRMELLQTEERVYDTAGNFTEDSTTYTYNAVNYLPATITSRDSKGSTITVKNYFIEDYNLSLPAHDVMRAMQSSNMIHTPVATETWQTKPGGQPELLSASVTEYGTAPNGSYRPVRTYALQSNQPVTQMAAGVFNPDVLIRTPALIKPVTAMTYDSAGNLVQTLDTEGDAVSSTLYDYGNRYAVAVVTNAKAAEVAYSSFEADGRGNWITRNEAVTDKSITGNRCLQLNYDDVRTTIAITKDYTLSFWATNSAFTINGGITPVITGPTINGWTYYQYALPPGSPSPVIGTQHNNNCRIDELRLYPATATMVTATYAPGTGKTSTCDANNRIVYTEYDGLGRISKQKDEKGNTIKTCEYHYQQN